MSEKTNGQIPHFQKALKRFLKVIDCTQQLQVREKVVGFEKALGAVKVIIDQIQYRSQSLLNLARGYFRAKIVAGWYERKTMRSALNGTGSKNLYLIKAVFNSSSQQTITIIEVLKEF